MNGAPLASAALSSHWDYSELASTYDLRPDYSDALLHSVMNQLGLMANDVALDIGAGTGKLTRILCAARLSVIAIEPNSNMLGIARAKPALRSVQWIAATGDSLPLKDRSAQLVAYGSSFNVVDQRKTLDECARILVPGGSWMAVWNHRDLDDPLQKAIESAIRRQLPNYEYGNRRESPENTLLSHARFAGTRRWEMRFVAPSQTSDWLAAWRSHATLRRQAGGQLPSILDSIAEVVRGLDTLDVPYFTRVWTAQRIAS